MGRPVLAAQPKPIAKHLTVVRSAELEGAFEVLASLVVNAINDIRVRPERLAGTLVSSSGEPVYILMQKQSLLFFSSRVMVARSQLTGPAASSSSMTRGSSIRFGIMHHMLLLCFWLDFSMRPGGPYMVRSAIGGVMIFFLCLVQYMNGMVQSIYDASFQVGQLSVLSSI